MTKVSHRLHKIAAIVHGGGFSFETTAVDGIRIRWPLKQSRQFHCGEHPDARLIRSLIQHFPARGMFFDIGANAGLYSMALARALGSRFRGVAFEPCPSTAQCLRTNLALNGLGTIEIHQVALSSSEGTITFSNYPNGLNNFAAYDANEHHPTIEVPCTTLDAFCSRENILPNLCKIDVEAHELHVLVGGRDILERYHPVLLLEVHGASLTAPDRDAIVVHLKDWGYGSISDMEGRPIGTLPDRTRHILCTP